jgi:hypothetical protein
MSETKVTVKPTKKGVKVKVEIPHREEKSVFDCPYYTKTAGMTQWGFKEDCARFQPRWFKTKEEAMEEAQNTVQYDESPKLIFHHPDLGFSFVPANINNEQAINRTLRAFHPDAGVVDEIMVWNI